MTDMPRTCLYCSEAFGCRYLSDSRGVFVPERVITEENPRECKEWAPVGSRQKWVRDMMYRLQGDGGVRVIHQMPRIIMDSLVQREQEEEKMNVDDNPDFASMLREGMTTEEREAQLRYETDPEGNVLVDEQGKGRPRAQYVISKFATDPGQHIQLDHSAGMFYTLDAVVKFILDKEVELGYLVKSKKPKKENQPAGPKGPAAKQETSMPIEGRKIIRPTSKAAEAPAAAAPKGGPVGLPKAPGKVAPPPKRPATQAETAQAAAPAASIDIRELIPDIQVAVGQAVSAAIEELKKELLGAIQASRNDSIDAITILHDLAAQTGGTFRGEDGSVLPDKFDTERKILDYIPQ